jgi:3-isopropylmalate dehydrogenase
MSRKRYRIACLAGDGVGPELMAEASRALSEVSRLHGFTVDEVHAPFGGEAVSRFGHALPPATRAAYRGADAVLVASTRESAIEGVKADLDLSWRITRVRISAGGDIAVVSPLAAESRGLAVERAFELARSRRGRITSVGGDDAWSEVVASVAERHGGLLVESLPLEAALPELVTAPEQFCVLVTDEPFALALSDMAAFGREPSERTVASGRLAEHGPGIFGPTHGSAPDIAGQGVANPSGLLLAAALMLGEGLGERAAGRTLERAVTDAVDSGVRTADLAGSGVAATTRSFTDAVLELLPGARTDTEFFVEAWR